MPALVLVGVPPGGARQPGGNWGAAALVALAAGFCGGVADGARVGLLPARGVADGARIGLLPASGMYLANNMKQCSDMLCCAGHRATRTRITTTTNQTNKWINSDSQGADKIRPEL